MIRHLFAAGCFVLGTTVWWPFGLLGIIGLAVADRWLYACMFGGLLDLVYRAPTAHLSNLFGFPFLGFALSMGVVMYLSQRAVRRTSHTLPGVQRVNEDTPGIL